MPSDHPAGRPGDPAGMRVGYRSPDGPDLAEDRAPADPLDLFAAWFAEVAAAPVPEPNAMVLSTVSAEGWPQARTVLLKGYDGEGLRFFTNTSSAKAADLAATPRASVVFPWHAVQRQVRVAGGVRRLPDDVVAAYFATRPRDAQLGAWASPQSEVVGSRAELEARLAEVAERFPEDERVPVPPYWGGYRVEPSTWEFWAGRAGRLHDRLRYRRTDGPWLVERLAP